MSSSSFLVEATLQPDGVTLRLEKKLALPPGPVTITVRPAPVSSGMTMLETLDRIHTDQKKRGQKAMTDEAMAAEIAQARIEDDGERWREIWSQTGERTDKV